MNIKKIAGLCMLGFMLSGCASVIEGTSQVISVNTNPSGASCTLNRNPEGIIGQINPTPAGVTVKKTKYDIFIKCNKDGYQEATYFNKSSAAGATAGNLILGGGIGWAIDSASGADNKYDSPVNITMVPVTVAPASVPQPAPAKTSVAPLIN